MKYWAKIEDLLKDLHTLHTGDREIQFVVLHHTWDPDHAHWHGEKGAEAIKEYWLESTKENGWEHPLGGHFIVDPAGGIYLPFGDLSQPLNANSNLKVNREGIAIETVGNFDVGHDRLAGSQKHAVLGLIGGLLVRFGLGMNDVFFHRSFENYKDCPGSSLNLAQVRQEAAAAMDWVRHEGAPCKCCPGKAS